MKILLARPRGFCAGVDRAIAIVERALMVHGAPIYVRHEIVHNKYVVKQLHDKGSIFVQEIDEVPDGSVLVFSAHGVPKAIKDRAYKRDLIIYDATCPLVRKVHAEVEKMDSEGYQIVMIGHAGHPEVEGTVGQVSSPIQIIERPSQVKTLVVKNPNKLAYVSQTTISIDDAKEVIKALKDLYPQVLEPKKADVCYATQNRQDAVKQLAKLVDLVLVVGSKASSNSNRLREVAEGVGTTAHLLDGPEELKSEWFKDVETVGITAGASAPEILVREIIDKLQSMGGQMVETMGGAEENVEFPLPKGLWKKDLQEAEKKRNIHTLPAPFGSVKLHYKKDKLVRCELLDRKAEWELPEKERNETDKALERYFAGDIAALQGWPISREGSLYRKRVWRQVRTIAPGTVKTYGEIAKKLRSSPRAVGMAVGDNPLPIFVPCHRVVGQKNLLGFGHSKEGLKFQKWLLEHEKKHTS